jgi:hypothetical protein
MLRNLLSFIAIFVIALTPTITAAQRGSDIQLRNNFEELLQQQSRTWWTVTYQSGSVGWPVVLESTSDGRAAVFAAGFRYTNGTEDVVYATVTDGARTCLSYRSESGPCTLYRSTRQAPSQGSGSGLSGGDLLIGGILLCAMFCGGNSAPSRRDNDGYDAYVEDCINRGRQPGNC